MPSCQRISSTSRPWLHRNIQSRCQTSNHQNYLLHCCSTSLVHSTTRCQQCIPTWNTKRRCVHDQPPGFVDSILPSYICKLNKSISGLKQEPRVWYEELALFFWHWDFSNPSQTPLCSSTPRMAWHYLC